MRRSGGRVSAPCWSGGASRLTANQLSLTPRRPKVSRCPLRTGPNRSWLARPIQGGVSAPSCAGPKCKQREAAMPIVKCSACKQDVSDTALVCPHCGQEQPEKQFRSNPSSSWAYVGKWVPTSPKHRLAKSYYPPSWIICAMRGEEQTRMPWWLPCARVCSGGSGPVQVLRWNA